MLAAVARFRNGQLELAKLVDDLRGLYVEADPHAPSIRAEFEGLWASLDGELELRTQPWAPPGAASDAALADSLDAFTGWVKRVLDLDRGHEHC